jgi:glutaryl-CoA dehydrogenase (non-decarboxylating)
VIDFSLTDENRLVRESVREFVAAEILPNIRAWDEQGAAHPEVFAKMGELGYLGAPIPEAWGGTGMDYVSLAILCEELERADTAFRVVMSVHVGLNSLALLQWGTDDQRQRWLVPQAQGTKLATFALTEPGAGTDAASLQTNARRDGDAYILNGSCPPARVVRPGDRPSPAGQADAGDGRGDGDRAAPRVARGLAEEPRGAQHARDLAGEVARDGA